MSLLANPLATPCRLLQSQTKRSDAAIHIILALLVGAVAFLPYLILVNRSAYLLAAHVGAIPLGLSVARLKKRDLTIYSAMAMALFIVLSGVRSWTASPGWCNDLAVAVGLAAIFRLVASAFDPTSDAGPRHALLALLVVQIAVVASRVLSYTISKSVTVGYDQYLYACDSVFGQISFGVGRLFVAVPSLAWLCRTVYDGLPFGVVAVFAFIKGSSTYRWFLILNFVIVGIIGRFCYPLMPAMGPAYEFPGQFPAAPPTLSAFVIQPRIQDALYNAMPSLHATWALMLLWWTYGQKRWLQIAAGLFLVFTLLATLGLGEHYLVDLIVAVPFSVLTFAIVDAAMVRRIDWVSIGTVAGLVALWLILLRSGALVSMPLGVWLLSIITLVLSLCCKPGHRFPGSDICF